MAEYKVDKGLLESYSTEEILRILKEEKDDYTPEAIKVLAEVLESRGVHGRAPFDPQPQVRSAVSLETGLVQEGVLVSDPGDAVRVLNTLLSGVIGGTIDPQVAQVSANIVMGILRARELEFMTEPAEES